jgi:hypothetical protein
MTDGEQLVWAAVFAKLYDLSNPPPHVTKPGRDKVWRAWERGQVVDAVERAGHAVRYLREIRGHVKEGFGDNSDVYQMLVEMLT